MGNRIDELVDKMKSNPKSVRFSDLEAVCQNYFGKSRKSGGSHCVYKTPWHGDPRINSIPRGLPWGFLLFKMITERQRCIK